MSFVDNNVGFNSLRATMKLLPLENHMGERSEIFWSFVVDAMDGWTLKDSVSFYDATLQGMSERMKEALGAAKKN